MTHRLGVQAEAMCEDLSGRYRSPGFIALHRSIREHHYYSDPQRFWAFMDILMEVRFRAGCETWRSGRHADRVWVPRGAMLTSVRKLARRWHETLGWSESTVWRFLKNAEDHGELIAPSKPGADRPKHCLQHHPALLIVVNYERYNPEHGSRRNSDWNDNESLQQHPSYKNKAEQGSDNEAGGVPARLGGADNSLGILRICDAFRRARGKSGWLPAKSEVAKVAAALAKNGGDCESIAATVYRVTKRDTDRGKKIKSVCYGLAVWERQSEATALSSLDVASEARRREQAEPDLRGSGSEPMSDDQAERATRALQNIREMLESPTPRRKP